MPTKTRRAQSIIPMFKEFDKLSSESSKKKQFSTFWLFTIIKREGSLLVCTVTLRENFFCEEKEKAICPLRHGEHKVLFRCLKNLLKCALRVIKKVIFYILAFQNKAKHDQLTFLLMYRISYKR